MLFKKKHRVKSQALNILHIFLIHSDDFFFYFRAFVQFTHLFKKKKKASKKYFDQQQQQQLVTIYKRKMNVIYGLKIQFPVFFYCVCWFLNKSNEFFIAASKSSVQVQRFLVDESIHHRFYCE